VLESAANVGSYPYAGGLRFSINPSESYGQRVSQVEWFSRGRWKAISLVQTYPIATTFSLAEGNAGYLTLFDAIERVDTDLLIRDVFIDYARAVGTLKNPPLERYSTQEYVQAPS
jgi:5'-nucleotidase/UDP-sugar diphosphatase